MPRTIVINYPFPVLARSPDGDTLLVNQLEVEVDEVGGALRCTVDGPNLSAVQRAYIEKACEIPMLQAYIQTAAIVTLVEKREPVPPITREQLDALGYGPHPCHGKAR